MLQVAPLSCGKDLQGAERTAATQQVPRHLPCKTRLCQAAQAHQGGHRQTAPTIAEPALQTDRSMEQDMRNSHR